MDRGRAPAPRGKPHPPPPPRRLPDNRPWQSGVTIPRKPSSRPGARAPDGDGRMRHSVRWIVVAGVVLAVAASLGAAPGASAADRTFTLYGDRDQGWRVPGGSFADAGPAPGVGAAGPA